MADAIPPGEARVPAAPDTATTIAVRHRGALGGPIGALRDLVDANGWITPEDMAAVAEVFNISRAEVLGIVSFYGDLRTAEPRGTLIRLCEGEACQAVGGRALHAELAGRLEAAGGDLRVELETVVCLGLCPVGPAAEVGGRLIARSTANAILGACE